MCETDASDKNSNEHCDGRSGSPTVSVSLFKIYVQLAFSLHNMYVTIGLSPV